MADKFDLSRSAASASRSSLLGKAGGEQVLVVDVSARAAKAQVVREGYQVPAVTLDKRRAEFFLDQLEAVDLRLVPRVVFQNIPAGTRVTRGTSVDLVLAPVSSVPFEIFEEVHEDLRGKSLDAVVPVLDANPKLRQTLLKYERSEEVPEAERKLISDSLQEAGVVDQVSDEVPGKSFDLAFKSTRNALAFR